MATHNEPPKPPRWPDRLLDRFVAPHLREDLQGDLYEIFRKRAEQVGPARAKREYTWAVLHYLTPFFFKRQPEIYPQPYFLTLAMIRNYVKIAFRNLSKSKGYSFINVAGLAAGMACTIVLFLVIKHETGYDQNHTNGNRIYRVETENKKEKQTYPGTYTGMVNALHTDVPEIESVVPLFKVWGKTFSVPASDKRFKESFVFAGNELFHLLDYQWVAGDDRTVLSQPNTVVLSRAYAEKYFGTTDVIGKTLQLDNKQELQVVGVVENYPTTTGFPFNILVSFPTIKNTDPGFDLNKWNGWGDNFQVYVLLKNGIRPEQLTQRFSTIVLKYMGKEALPDKRFFLNPLSQLHYDRNLSGRTANIELLKTLSFIGFFVLLIACFNFINLTTAQAFKRAKEVGIRKAVGSNRLSLVYQFLTEAGLITFFAVLIAVLIAQLSLPFVSDTLAVPLTASDLFTWQTGVFVAGLMGITVLLSGIYPAFRLSGMAPIWALKNNPFAQGKPLFTLRQGLVVVQFTISLILISSALLINRQLVFFRNADLGFNKSAIVTVGLPNNSPAKLQLLRHRLTASPQIKEVSFSFNSASAESNWMQNMEYRKKEKAVPIKTQMKMADSHFLTTYGIQLLAGENLRDSDTSSTSFKVIANEIFLDRMGISRPADAIGQKVYYGDGQEFATIVGVMKNFHVNSLHQKIDPTVLQVIPNNFYQAGIKLPSEKLETMQAALAHIEKAWTATYPEHVFEYHFLDESLAQAYESETRTSKLIQVSTFLAVLIACFGLFGLATFTAEQRTKEIGVRKVLGASVLHVWGLLSKEFVYLVLIAFLIATPIAYYFLEDWLTKYEFRTDLSWWIFALAGLGALLITLMTVSYQSIKAALLNPVKSLRSE
ncbi:MAG: ABC transporter permease [Spirosomataceae bacterium]